MALQPKKYWLMKSEPHVFSIENLQKETYTLWEGVRNYQARNYMMNDMREGDEVLFYHSSAKPPFETGIAGLAVISRAAVADPLQFNKKSDYFDPKASPEKPIWFCVQVKFNKVFKKVFTLAEIKATPELADMLVIKRGQRLSIQPVSEKDFLFIGYKCN
jgi:predicted RNA-binding protein with PUA-like domain